MRNLSSEAVRNLVFGVEDSLVSTVGLISGVASAGVPRTALLMTGIVLIVVEAFSMGAGSLVSGMAAEEVVRAREVPVGESFGGALIMFFSYVLAGMLVLFPYFTFDPVMAFRSSIGISLATLFALGAFSSRIIGAHWLKKGLIMMLVGGAAIAVGIGVAGLIS